MSNKQVFKTLGFTDFKEFTAAVEAIISRGTATNISFNGRVYVSGEDVEGAKESRFNISWDEPESF